MNWDTSFARCLGGFTKLVLAGAMALTLSACDLYVVMKSYTKSTPAERQKFIEDTFVNGKSDLLYARLSLLGRTGLYIDWDEYRALIRDEESLFKYAVGLYLARNPRITYASLMRNVDVSGLMTETEFNYYRLWGQDLLDQVQSREENAWLVEREALFRKRARLSDETMEKLHPERYEELLRDTEAFESFLTDDDFAGQWLHGETGNTLAPQHTLGPVFTGVTPGTGS